MGPNLDAAARQGKAGGHNRFMRVACAAVFASVLAFGAGAQEFVIPGAAELAAMSVQAKIEMERQLTADAQDWPRTEFFEPLFNPDPMALVTPKVSGKLTGVDALHRASGEAMLFAFPGGETLLRFDGLDVANGPGLHVYLVRTRSPRSPEDIEAAGFLDVGPLKANLGNYQYFLEESINTFRSVVLYSQPFDVIFAVASLQ